MTYATLLTPPTLGAIAVIQIAGPDATQVVAGMATNPRVPTLAPRQTARSDLAESGDILDDALIIRICEHSWEVHVHGGTAVVDAVLRAAATLGAATTSPEMARGQGSFGVGLAADVALVLPQALTLTGARLIAAQADGGLAAWARHWREAVTAGRLWQLHAAVQWLLTRSADLGRLLTPPRITLVGAPNTGKSTLANALFGRPMAITSNTPGTTRDWIDGQTVFVCGEVHVPVLLVDTAGIRETPDRLEQESIARTRQQAERAELVILVLDATGPGAATGFPACDLIALNKCDLLPDVPALRGCVPIIPVSAKTHDGLAELMSAAVEALDLADIRAEEPFAFAPGQRALLEEMQHAANVSQAQALLNTLLEA